MSNGYITRWRIEELFRVQKQEYQLEQVRTLSLNSLCLIYRLINYLIGHHTLLLEREQAYTKQVLHRSKALFDESKVRFKLYCLIRGLAEILKDDRAGIHCYKRVKHQSSCQQLVLAV